MVGKIIGGIIGAFAAGPFGFVAGAAIGHFALDYQLKKGEPKRADAGRSPRDTSFRDTTFNTSNNLFIEFACQGAAKIAKAKGFVAQNDINELEQIFKQLNFDTEMRRRAISHFRNAKDEAYGLEDIARNFIKHFPQRPARHAFFGILLRVALSDHHLDKNEAIHLRNVARILHIDPSVVDDMERQHSGQRQQNSGSRSHSGSGSNSGGRSAPSQRYYGPSLAEEYAVLGLTPAASTAEVKKAYRTKCKDLHPDVLRSKGIGEHAMKVIEDELRKINEAYEKIMKAKS